MDSDHLVDPHAVPQVDVQLVEGAGERSTRRPEHADVKSIRPQDGEYSVCFERMGMGDLEVVEVVDVADEGKPPSARAAPHIGVPQEAWQPAAPAAPSSVSYCYLEWTPSEDSDDEDVGLLDALDVQLQASPRDECQDPQCSGTSRMQFALQSSKGSQTEETIEPFSSPTLVRSKLGITNVSIINLPPSESETQPQLLAQAHMSWPEQKPGQYDDVDVDDDGILLDDEEDEVCRRAPTPENTPQHSPSEEHQHGLGMGLELDPGSTLYSTLKDMALLDETYSGGSTPSPEATPEVSLGRPSSAQQQQQQQQQQQAASASGGTLGRVWSRLLGRTSRTRTETVSNTPPTLTHQADTEDSDDADYEERVLEVDPQTIDELEATLEEVRLDGDADDPVVSYLVEEVEEMVRVPGTASREVTVEEVHDDATEDELPPPAPRPSGLLSRLFSKTKTSQDVSSSSEPVRRTRGSGSAKRGKVEAPSRDRALHIHRLKPRQTNKAALRSSLPRCLTRWLRQGEGGAGGATTWGAEGDAGESVVGGVSPRLGSRALRPPRPPAPAFVFGVSQPPALQRTRRTPCPKQPQTEDLEDDSQAKVYSVKTSKEEKLLADFGSQTVGCIEVHTPLVHKESRGVEAVLNITMPSASDSF